MKNANFEGEKSKIGFIFKKVSVLPYFTIDDLASIETDRIYLKILLSRYAKAGKLIRLKKGFYVSREYLKNLSGQRKDHYVEFVANLLCLPSYLSLDYVLYQHGILTEIPANFTSIAKEKTVSFSNPLGNFFYHKIKERLFCGFETQKAGDLAVSKATKAKAVFDFLYLRKNHLPDKAAVKELRLNVFPLNNKDKKEIRHYAEIDGSKKMKEICGWFLS
jgi:predicted transcriptional regulator of viral defense system